MSGLAIVGGVYHERCVWPYWNRVYGSAGRAAEAAAGHVKGVRLFSYANAETEIDMRALGELAEFEFHATAAEHLITFDYVHSLSTPIIAPPPSILLQASAIDVKADAVLRFGMLEGDARVTAKRCVYDPQSAFRPPPFGDNGSTAAELAIVANRQEIIALARNGDRDPREAARTLLKQGAAVVVIKAGVGGAFVIDHQGETRVPAYQSEFVFKIGSGDVFAAMFAVAWAVNGRSPQEAAFFASRCVAEYANQRSLPVSPSGDAPPEAIADDDVGVFIAASFSGMGQRWVVDEARRCMLDLGLKVFSPLHALGTSTAAQNAVGDGALLEKADRVFAVLDGIDNRALFTIGLARAQDMPVYLLAQSATPDDLRMLEASDCRIFEDFTTALYHTAWRT